MNKEKRNWKLPLLIFIVLIGVQLPFIKSDPDRLTDVNTRGAWIDESLYVFQAREWVDSAQLNLTVNDAFVRSPVFQGLVTLFFLIFGTHLFAARLVTIILVAASLGNAISRRNTRIFGLIMAAVTFTQFHVFQFSHHSLVYMCANAWIIFAMTSFAEACGGRNVMRNTLLSSMYVFLAYGTSIQMAGAAILLPATAFLLWITRLRKPDSSPYLFILTTLSGILFAAIYGLGWFLPNKDTFDTIVFYQTEGRFPQSIEDLKLIISFNYSNVLWIVELIPYMIASGIFILIWPFILRKNATLSSSALFIFACLWLCIEFPKTSMFYIPFRYLLPFITALGTVISLSLTTFLNMRNGWKLATIAIVVAFLIPNTIHQINAYNRRTNDMASANQYLSSHMTPGTVALGAWAPSFTWDVKVKCVPVWNNYLNFNQPIEKYHPAVIVSEFNQADNDDYYETNNIRLDEISDSLKITGVWRYNIAFYWMSK